MTWIVYRGPSKARVAKYNLDFKDGYRYNLPAKVAKDLIENHVGFSLSKKERRID